MGKIQNNSDPRKVGRETTRRTGRKKKVNPESLTSDKVFLQTHRKRRSALIALAEK